MPAAAALGLILPMITELVKGGVGVGQGIRANKLGKMERPMQETPQGFEQALALIQGLANNQQLPGQYLMQENIGAGVSNSIRSIQESAGGSGAKLAALSGVHGAGINAQRDLDITAAQQQQQDVMNLSRMMEKLGQYEQSNWQNNINQPFMDAMDAKRREGDASNKNIYGALGGISSLAGIPGMEGLGGAMSGLPPEGGTDAPGMEQPYNPAGDNFYNETIGNLPGIMGQVAGISGPANPMFDSGADNSILNSDESMDLQTNLWESLSGYGLFE